MTTESLISAFHHAASAFPFYGDILKKRNITPAAIQTLDDFFSTVPILTKEEIFGVYGLQDLYADEGRRSYISAILSSGTTGMFSFSLLTEKDVETQRMMVDSMMEKFFSAKERPPLIINALPMGVSFVSRYPVIPTSVRSDIACKAITTFGKERQVVIVTDPHFLKKILEEGIAQGVSWGAYDLSCIVGGAASSDSYARYVLQLLNAGREEKRPPNLLLGTMGVTEVGLNIFGATPDLIALRHTLEEHGELREGVLGGEHTTCPELMYHMSPSVHVEICDPDEYGVGDVVLTHLDTSLPTMLIRYKTGDRGQFLSPETITRIVPDTSLAPLPPIAIYGRSSEYSIQPVTPAEVRQALYARASYAACITGHFLIENGNDEPFVRVHMKKGIEKLPELSVRNVPCIGEPYNSFPRDIELNYENKWKHTL